MLDLISQTQRETSQCLVCGSCLLLLRFVLLLDCCGSWGPTPALQVTGPLHPDAWSVLSYQDTCRMGKNTKLAPSSLPCTLCLACLPFLDLLVYSVNLIICKKFVLFCFWSLCWRNELSHIFLNKALSPIWSMSSLGEMHLER